MQLGLVAGNKICVEQKATRFSLKSTKGFLRATQLCDLAGIHRFDITHGSGEGEHLTDDTSAEECAGVRRDECACAARA